jgi:hypothetical protein
MYVKLTGEDEYREVAFDVIGLDRSYKEIAELVQKRGIAALS